MASLVRIDGFWIHYEDLLTSTDGFYRWNMYSKQLLYHWAVEYYKTELVFTTSIMKLQNALNLQEIIERYIHSFPNNKGGQSRAYSNTRKILQDAKQHVMIAYEQLFF